MCVLGGFREASSGVLEQCKEGVRPYHGRHMPSMEARGRSVSGQLNEGAPQRSSRKAPKRVRMSARRLTVKRKEECNQIYSNSTFQCSDVLQPSSIVYSSHPIEETFPSSLELHTTKARPRQPTLSQSCFRKEVPGRFAEGASLSRAEKTRYLPGMLLLHSQYHNRISQGSNSRKSSHLSNHKIQNAKSRPRLSHLRG